MFRSATGVLLWVALCLLSGSRASAGGAPARPGPGDLVFVQINTHDTLTSDSAVFLTLRRLDLAGMKVTDNGVRSTTAIRPGEGTDVLPADWGDVPAGTLVTIVEADPTPDNNPADGLLLYPRTRQSFTTEGDQCIAYVDYTGNKYFVAGINFGNHGWYSAYDPGTHRSAAPGTPTDYDAGTSATVRLARAVTGDRDTLTSSSGLNGIRNPLLWEGRHGTALPLGGLDILFNAPQCTSGTVVRAPAATGSLRLDWSRTRWTGCWGQDAEDTRFLAVVRPDLPPGAPRNRDTATYANAATHYPAAPVVLTSATVPLTSGTVTTADAGRVVYFDYGTSVTVTGLDEGRNYRAAVYACNGNGPTARFSAVFAPDELGNPPGGDDPTTAPLAEPARARTWPRY